MTIGYDTVNRCLAVKRTPENTSYEMMFKICINKLLDKNTSKEEIAKYTNLLLAGAKAMDQANI